MYCCIKFNLAVCEDGVWLAKQFVFDTKLDIDVAKVFALTKSMIVVDYDKQWYRVNDTNSYDNITELLCDKLECAKEDIVDALDALYNSFVVRTNTRVIKVYDDDRVRVMGDYDHIVSWAVSYTNLYVSDTNKTYHLINDVNRIQIFAKRIENCDDVIVTQAATKSDRAVFVDIFGNLVCDDGTKLLADVKSIHSFLQHVFVHSGKELHWYSWLSENRSSENLMFIDVYPYMKDIDFVYQTREYLLMVSGSKISIKQLFEGYLHKPIKTLSFGDDVIAISKPSILPLHERDHFIVTCKSGHAYYVSQSLTDFTKTLVQTPSLIRVEVKRVCKNARSV